MKTVRAGYVIMLIWLLGAAVAHADCRGCCSRHGGVVCNDGVTMCRDGTSLSARCSSKGCNKCGGYSSSHPSSRQSQKRNYITVNEERVPKPWTGKVVGISDGDTVTVMRDGRGTKVRLAEIDCPESGQPFGMKAKRFVADAIGGGKVTVKPTAVDRYDRIVAHVILPNGEDLNAALILNGLAWHYKQYSTDEGLSALEKTARSDRIGLWSDRSPIPPWDWRRGIRQTQSRDVEEDTASASYHGNVYSQVFHSPGCKHYKCKNCIAIFDSREAAIDSGYRPCRICKP